MDGWTDEWMDRFSILQDFLLNLNHTLPKQGTGTADHLLPLDCYCHFSMVFNENLNNRASWTEGGQTTGWTDGQTDGRTDSPCVLQDFVPFGAAALLPFSLNHILLKQGTGTADHLLPLGCYYSLTSLLLPKCSSDLKYGPFPPARD